MTEPQRANGGGHVFAPGGGQILEFLGHRLSVLASLENSGGALSVFEADNPPSTVADRHIHHDAVKASYILGGSYHWYVGDEEFEVGPGAFVLVPRHVPHHFASGPDGGRQLFIFTPAGMEHFFVEVADAFREHRLNEAFIDSLSERYDVEQVAIPY